MLRGRAQREGKASSHMWSLKQSQNHPRMLAGPSPPCGNRLGLEPGAAWNMGTKRTEKSDSVPEAKPMPPWPFHHYA